MGGAPFITEHGHKVGAEDIGHGAEKGLFDATQAQLAHGAPAEARVPAGVRQAVTRHRLHADGPAAAQRDGKRRTKDGTAGRCSAGAASGAAANVAVDVGAGAQQHEQGVGSTALDGVVQGAQAEPVAQVDVGAKVQQQLHDGSAVALGGDVQLARGAGGRGAVGAGAGLQQQARDGRGALRDGLGQRFFLGPGWQRRGGRECGRGCGLGP